MTVTKFEDLNPSPNSVTVYRDLSPRMREFIDAVVTLAYNTGVSEGLERAVKLARIMAK